MQLDSGSVYEICGEAIGMGGGSILYPAHRLIDADGSVRPDGFFYALKECYPVSEDRYFGRNSLGEITPLHTGQADINYLRRAQQMQLEEGLVSQKIYRTASRILPVRELSNSVVLTPPGGEPGRVSNTVTVMDSLSQKGRSLGHWLRERRRFTPTQTVRIIQQVLFALQEVHEAGFLHLDVQDGNIFLRGTLAPDDKSELVTLIDFGSARAMIDGKTAPIEDRVIFTTAGFSPPEILLHNDGTLQLGPEADLFSVGCLMLMLVTGQRTDVRTLLNDKSGYPLKPNQLRRIKCPKHLVGKLQDILKKALERDPKDRYHTAAQMLADVTDLAGALQPYRTDLSSVTYDAFVCYKHGSVDSQAAISLQRELERFRVGKDVAKNRNPFRRIFVDEGELSSCADFGLQIREALKNSGWLIVVCSPDTPLSPWVQSEIQTFLEYHDRSRILAVLTGGDENVSFPEELKGSRNEGEILAADARGKDLQTVLKKLRGDALLKLAAPMLGTTFDTLKQRQKVYTLQRVAMAAAAALFLAVGFSIYAVDRTNVIREQAGKIAIARDEAVERAEEIAAQAMQIEEQADQIKKQADQIEKEYRNALINESLFLVGQAENRLADSDPLGAMELLLQALPSENQDRPIVPRAEYLLGEALNTYRLSAEAMNTVTVTGTIPTDCSKMFLNESDTLLYAWKSDKIQCWDTEALKLLWERELQWEESINSEPYLFLDSYIAYKAHNMIVGIDALTGENRWVLKDTNVLFCDRPENSDHLVILEGTQGAFWEAMSEEIDLERQFTAKVIKGKTGETALAVPFVLPADRYVTKIWSSPDMHWLAISTDPYGVSSVDSNPDTIYMVDLLTGQCSLAIEPDQSIAAVQFLSDGSLAVLKAGGTYVYIKDVSEVPQIYLDPFQLVLERYATPSCSKLLWRQEVSCYMCDGQYREIREVLYEDNAETGIGLVFLYEDRGILLNRDTGLVIQNYQFPEGVAERLYGENKILTVNIDGSFAIANFSGSRIVILPSFSKKISQCCWNGGSLFVQHNETFEDDFLIRRYELDRSDPTYETIATAVGHSWSFETLIQTPDESSVLLTESLGDSYCFIDLSTGEQFIHHLPKDPDEIFWRFLGNSGDGMSVIWAESEYDDPACWIDNKRYFSTDLRSGQTQELVQPERPMEDASSEGVVCINGKLYLGISFYEQNTMGIYVWDPDEDTMTELYRTHLERESDSLKESFDEDSLVVDAERGQLYFAISSYNYGAEDYFLRRLVYLDLNTGENRELSVDLLPEIDPSALHPWMNNYYLWNGDGTYGIFACGSSIYVINEAGGLVSTIALEAAPFAIRFVQSRDSLLVFSQEDNILREYRLEDGQQLTALDLTDYISIPSYYGPENLTWTYLDDTIMLFGDYLNSILIDTSGEALFVTANVNHVLGYDKEKNRFIHGASSNGFVIGTCNRYTLSDLIRMASELVGY